MALKRIGKEFSDWAPEVGLAREGFMAALVCDEHPSHETKMHSDLFKWHVVIPGPDGTPYESGFFVLHYTFPRDYPFKPPRVYLKTPIYHSNVCPDGYLTPSMFPLLGDQWSPACKALDVAICVQSMLRSDQTWGVQNDIAQLYARDRVEHHRIARSWVQEHALVVPTGITSAWNYAFGPPLILTLHSSSRSEAVLTLTATNIAGTQVASTIIDATMKEAELRVLLAQELGVPERRLKMCLPDATVIHSSRQPIFQFFAETATAS